MDAENRSNIEIHTDGQERTGYHWAVLNGKNCVKCGRPFTGDKGYYSSALGWAYCRECVSSLEVIGGEGTPHYLDRGDSTSAANMIEALKGVQWHRVNLAEEARAKAVGDMCNLVLERNRLQNERDHFEKMIAELKDEIQCLKNTIISLEEWQ